MNSIASPITLRSMVCRLALALVALGAISGCGDMAYHSADPVSDVKNKDLQLNQREIALDEMMENVKAGTVDAKAARESLKDLIWKGGAPTPLRQRALALLLSDTNPESVADTRNLLRLRLPTETAWPLIEDICKAIGSRASDPAWRDQAAGLVRSYARKVPSPEDSGRPERAALLALFPDRSVEATIFEVFAQPKENGAPERPEDYSAKASSAAWELLGRLDPDGSKRNAIMASRSGSEPALVQIQKSARELGVVPVTAAELTWLKRLMDEKDPRNAAWWSSASAAVAGLSATQRQGLQLRHIEPVRWAAANRTQWLSAERSELLSELQSRLANRVIHRMTEEVISGQVSKETVKEWEPALVWGDALAILVADEAVHQPGVVAELFVQAAADRADESTEYGGVLWATDQYAKTQTQEPFLVRGYQPRPMQRVNDRTFIAPEEMFADSGRALAHYHFHVQTDSNAEYAGPGRGDLEYAQTNGRSCVVFTSVKAGVLDADYYQRGGVVIDLGEVRSGK